jgi:hypothetical protein
MSISAVPSTTSRPFTLALPVRSSLPMTTSATPLTRMGTPPRVVTTMRSKLRGGFGLSENSLSLFIDQALALDRTKKPSFPILR